jgi:cGMP-dependent protein kinase
MGGGFSHNQDKATDVRATVTHVPARGKDSHFRERSITEPTRIRSKHVRPDRGFVHNEDLKGAVVEAWQEKAGFTVDDRPFETASFHHRSDAARKATDLVLEYYCFKGIIPEEGRDYVARAFVKHTFEQGELIYDQGMTGDCLYVIEWGEVEFIVDGKVVTKAESGSCFGELSLIYGTSRPSAARAASPTVRLWALARTVFRKLQIAMCMDSLEKSFRTAQSGCTMSQITTRAQESATLIQDGLRLKPHTVIGSGTAGVVAIVEAIEGSAPGGAADYPGPTASGGGGGGFPGNQIFALKQMSKRRLLENQMLKQALFEKESLLQCRDSPFVVKLVHTFQDESHVYFLSEFAQGGDLMESILDCKDNGELLSLDRVRFYSACLAEALVHVHQCDIIHRDVKPENCFIDAHGYLKLGDFGLAKPLPCALNIGEGRVEISPFSYTMCGSPQFLAPEVFMNAGYNKLADWWSYGCVVYEMLIGEAPFSGDLREIYCSVMSIGTGECTIADYMPQKSPKKNEGAANWMLPVCRHFMGSLLTRDVCRLNGMMLRQHHFFGSSFDWSAMKERTLPPPWTPSISGPVDDSHFPEVPAEHIQRHIEDAGTQAAAEDGSISAAAAAAAAAANSSAEDAATFEQFGESIDSRGVLTRPIIET